MPWAHTLPYALAPVLLSTLVVRHPNVRTHLLYLLPTYCTPYSPLLVQPSASSPHSTCGRSGSRVTMAGVLLQVTQPHPSRQIHPYTHILHPTALVLCTWGSPNGGINPAPRHHSHHASVTCARGTPNHGGFNPHTHVTSGTRQLVAPALVRLL